jgi:hypothetical protein
LGFDQDENHKPFRRNSDGLPRVEDRQKGSNVDLLSAGMESPGRARVNSVLNASRVME